MVRNLTMIIVTLALLSMAICLMAYDPLYISIVILILLMAWAIVTIVMFRDILRASRKTKVIIVLSVILIVSTVTTYWPLRLSFAIMTPELNHMAVQIEQGVVPVTPLRIGPFNICETGKNQYGNVYFWTVKRSYGSIGFVKCTDEALRTKFNVFFAVKLANGWHMIVED